MCQKSGIRDPIMPDRVLGAIIRVKLQNHPREIFWRPTALAAGRERNASFHPHLARQRHRVDLFGLLWVAKMAIFHLETEPPLADREPKWNQDDAQKRRGKHHTQSGFGVPLIEAYEHDR